MSKYGHRPHNWFEAIVNKLGGEERAEAFLRGEFLISKSTRSWREEGDVIYFSVISDGTTGEGWIHCLESKGFSVMSNDAKQMLCSPNFRPTSGVTIKVAILRGTFFKDEDRITRNIRAEADRRKLSKPNAELACLIRKNFTNEEIEAMGLWGIVAMHEPICNFRGDPYLLRVNRCEEDGDLDRVGGESARSWGNDRGFAFVVA